MTDRVSGTILSAMHVRVSTGGGRLLITANSVAGFSNFATICIRNGSAIRRGRNRVPGMSRNRTLVCGSVSPGRRFARPPDECARTSLIGTVRRGNVNEPDACGPAVVAVANENCITESNGTLCPARLNAVMDSLVTRGFRSVISVNFATSVRRHLSGIRSKRAG